MKAKSIKGNSTSAIAAALEQSKADGFLPTLAIAFISVALNRTAIAKFLEDQGIAIFGCTTNGEFIDEDTEKGSAAILLLDMKPDRFQIFFEEFPEKNYREVAKGIAQQAKTTFSVPAFLIGISNAAADGEEVLRGIEDVAGADVNAFGGAAGDDYAFSETFVFTNGKDSGNAMVCLALDESKVDVQGIATCGWKAVGTEKTVTRSEGNHVYTVDNVPVLDLTAKYGGIEDASPENNNLLVEIAANFPLQLQREKGDPVMRPGLVVDWNDRSYYTSGSVPQGSKVRFSLPPDFDVMDKVVKGVEHLKATKMPEADALVVFSCAGRILSLGPLMSQELEGIKNVWNVPMAGMFSNAELGRATGGNLEMHNLTTCCVALKEK
ncbi:FIST C-terminal domain-containing protein [Flavobacteriaceae bacterium F89]|uniref:FIST C-terminal domain-containing protein n=1 Tax=Cerina litoralis TaxID=2874477 RepID=A0AAE3ERW0_9FLAO|nr:FIST N-terminal domain-containing protein [Cerina litoralis]MCG2459250.1 FIST C-terminal domain-containing protein [Cerina litoralis]